MAKEYIIENFTANISVDEYISRFRDEKRQSVERKLEDMEIDLLDIFRKIVAIRKKIYKAATLSLIHI